MNIEKSIIATGGSKIKNVKNIGNTSDISIKIEKKKSFWKGFLIGIISSLIASVIWYSIEIYFNI